MADFTFLHAADIHLDSPLRGLEADAPASLIRGATREALVNLVDLALQKRVRFVLLAGDLYDGAWEDYPTGHFLVQQLGRLTQADIHVYAISGNHDAQSVLTRQLPWPNRAHMFDTAAAHSVHVPDLDVVVHGQGFAHAAVTDNIAKDYPMPVTGKLNIGLLHTACEDTNHGRYAPCTVEQLSAHGYDYWALGHVHARGILNEHPNWVVFPGNLQGRHIKEEGEKGATLVHVRAGRLHPEHHTLDVVRWSRVQIDLSGVASAEAMSARVRAAIAAAAIAAGDRLLAARLEIHGATRLHAHLTRDPGQTLADMRAIVAGLALKERVWLEKVQVHTRPELDLENWRNGSDAAATLLRSLEAEPTQAVTKLARDYALHMLDQVPGAREALGSDHPATRAAGGDIPPDLIQRARDLVLARLGEG